MVTPILDYNYHIHITKKVEPMWALEIIDHAK